jgi:chromosomal replication initiator protein
VGLITDIQAPEFETRIAILKMNAEYRGVKVPTEVVDYIARHVTSNIRELEGALLRAILYASMNQEALTRQSAAAALSDVFAPSDVSLTMPDIVTATAAHFSLAPDDVRSKAVATNWSSHARSPCTSSASSRPTATRRSVSTSPGATTPP